MNYYRSTPQHAAAVLVACLVLVLADAALEGSDLAFGTKNRVSCTGASADLEPAQCAYLQAQFIIWNMERYDGCKTTDPCACNWPGGNPSDNYITCEKVPGKNTTTVTQIQYARFDEYNQLGGFIHEGIGALKDLNHLDLCCNGITGTIPDSITRLSKLGVLALSDNNLTGTLPFFIGHLPKLHTLSVEHNYLSGTVPASFNRFTALNGPLKALLMNCNNFTGVLPAIDWAHITYDPTSPTGRVFDCFLSGDCEKPFANNNWACPLPTGAAEYCKAQCE